MNTLNEMSTTEMTLAHTPTIGIASTIIGFIAPFICSLLPIVQLLVALVGLAIGVLTIEAKLKERKLNKKK